MPKIHVEFEVSEGREADFIAALEQIDKNVGFGGGCVGWRAGDEVTIRQQLRLFVEAMEQKLRKNDHKTGWRELPVEALFRQLLLEIEEFKVAYEFFSPKDQRPELVDIANFALIVWDRLGMLDQDLPIGVQNAKPSK